MTVRKLSISVPAEVEETIKAAAEEGKPVSPWLAEAAAVKAVIPRNLDRIPEHKIVQIRQRFASQFDLWRAYADAVGTGLSHQLQDVESPDILSAYLTDAVRRYAPARSTTSSAA